MNTKTKKNRILHKNKNIYKTNKYTKNKRGNKYIKYGGVDLLEPTKEDKEDYDKDIQNKISNLENKTAATMNATEYKTYSNELNKLTKKSDDPRYKLDYEYMFSPLLSEEIKREKDSYAGKFFVGINLIKFFGILKNIFKQNKIEDPADKNYFDIFGEWVNEYNNYEKIQRNNMGYRNNTNNILKPEEELREDATLRELLEVSKKYSGSGKKGKVTPVGLLKLIKILDKYKKNEKQFIRAATILEIIHKYLSKGESRRTFFKSNKEIPTHILFEIEEFYVTEHMFMTQEELYDFSERLEFYRVKE